MAPSAPTRVTVLVVTVFVAGITPGGVAGGGVAVVAGAGVGVTAVIVPVVTAEMVVPDGTGSFTGAAAVCGATGLPGGVAGVLANGAVASALAGWEAVDEGGCPAVEGAGVVEGASVVEGAAVAAVVVLEAPVVAAVVVTAGAALEPAGGTSAPSHVGLAFRSAAGMGRA